MALNNVRMAALAATLLAGTTFAYAQSGSPSMDKGGTSAGHGGTHQSLGNGTSPGSRHGSGANSTTGAGNSSAAGGEMQKGDEHKSSTMKNEKNEKNKSASGEAEGGKTKAQKNAAEGKSSTSGAGAASEEHGKGASPSMKNERSKSTSGESEKGAKDRSATGTSERSGTSGKGSNAASSSSNAGTNVNLTTEQKTEIKKTVIDSKSAPRVTNVNFDVRVGTVIPTSVHFAPLPETIVRIHPAWRGYDYVVYNEEVIVIQPKTRKIVEIIVLS